MEGQDIPCEVLRLAEAFIFASIAPVTWKTLQPFLPNGFDSREVLEALQRHCADRGIVLIENAGAWTFRVAPDLAPTFNETRWPHGVIMELWW